MIETLAFLAHDAVKIAPWTAVFLGLMLGIYFGVHFIVYLLTEGAIALFGRTARR